MDRPQCGWWALVVMLAAITLVPPAIPTRAAPASQLDDNVVLQITNPQPGQRLQGRVVVTGYAADRRSPRGPGLNDRDIRLYLNDSSDEWNLFGYAVPGAPPPEATAALGPRFQEAGFRAFWETCAFPVGPYKLIIWVSSLVVPGARQIASVDVEVEPCAPGAVLFQQEDLSSRSRALADRFADFAAGLDARCPQSEPECQYSLSFRQQLGLGGPGSGTGYSYVVDASNGTFGLRYTAPSDEPGRFMWIVPPTPSPIVRRGPVTNRLAIIAQGDWLRLFMNGEQVGETHDERRPWGGIAWSVTRRADGRLVDVEFANLVVSTPGPPDTLGPVLHGP